MSMKCQGLVAGYSSRNSVSGRIEAASIADAIALLLGVTPRMVATWPAAAGVRLSAAMTATILCPSVPHAQAEAEQSRTASMTDATQSAGASEDCGDALKRREPRAAVADRSSPESRHMALWTAQHWR